MFTADGWTPLHEAAARGLMDTTRLLVEHGANLEIKNKGALACNIATLRAGILPSWQMHSRSAG